MVSDETKQESGVARGNILTLFIFSLFIVVQHFELKRDELKPGQLKRDEC